MLFEEIFNIIKTGGNKNQMISSLKRLLNDKSIDYIVDFDDTISESNCLIYSKNKIINRFGINYDLVNDFKINQEFIDYFSKKKQADIVVLTSNDLLLVKKIIDKNIKVFDNLGVSIVGIIGRYGEFTVSIKDKLDLIPNNKVYISDIMEYKHFKNKKNYVCLDNKWKSILITYIKKIFLLLTFMILNIFVQFKYFILALRPVSWIKNVIIFVPLIFGGLIFDKICLFKVIEVFFLFCIFVGCTYIFNDIKDIDNDKSHPKKKYRPLASGKLSVMFASFFALILSVLCIIYTVSNFGIMVFSLFLFYLLNTVMYTIYLKKLEILDVFSIALGFVIRGLIGTYAISIDLSPWLLIILFFGSLRFGFLKRYQEVMLGTNTRANISQYNADFLSQTISSIMGIIIIGWALYTFNSVQSRMMIFTVPFVTFLVIRYYYNIFFLKKYTESIEEIIIKDKSILICGFLLLILMLIIVFYNY